MNKIPITIGIIGHLDAVITEAHERIITDLLNDIQNMYPNSPVVLYSQLAKGVDTDIAKLFIELKQNKGRDYHLIVPIPFEIGAYEEAYSDTELKDFRKLLAAADHYFVLKNENNLKKNELYKNGGLYVSDHSTLLIAIWDQQYNGKKGGTSDIVYSRIRNTLNNGTESTDPKHDRSLISIQCSREGDNTHKKIKLNKNLFGTIIEDITLKNRLSEIEKLNS